LNWDIARYGKAIETCKLVRINVDNPFLDRVVENYLVERKINWYSLNARNSYYGQGADLGFKKAPEGQSEDCTISSHPGSSSAQMTWIQMAR
jgi:hypothetical protein